MADSLNFSTKEVFTFVDALTPLSEVSGMVAIGLEKNGALVAGVVYEGINPFNAWMHVAATPGARWLTRHYLRACFVYPFITCGVERVRGYVNASNTAARKFDEHLGFEQEAVLRGAASDGSDVIIYVMPKARCRYV
ncbi:MAG: GNAT family N-acetyltransferase [Candidatus Saccharibacteria bacterium]|nr:GNAT family N-acetyltransferase [Rhodoferax sp.]